MQILIILLTVVLVACTFRGTVTCEEVQDQDISWFDGTTWEKTQMPFIGSKIIVTVENGIGTGVNVDSEERWRKIHVDEKGEIVLKVYYRLRNGSEFWLKATMKFKKEGKVMIVTPKELGPGGMYRAPFEMKLVEE